MGWGEEMDLLGLSSAFETISYIPYINLQWKRRYYETGKWQAQIPESEYDPRIRFVYTPDRPELGMVERMESQATIKGDFVLISGRFMETIFDRQLAFPHITGTYELPALLQRITGSSWYKPDLYAITPSDNVPAVSVDVKWERDPIGGLLYETLEALEYSPRLAFDPVKHTFTLDVWQGKDRTQSQNENAYVTFSEDACYVKSFKYVEDESNYKNVVMILYGSGPSRYDVYGPDTDEAGRRWVLMSGAGEEEKKQLEQKAKEELDKYDVEREATVEVIQDGLLYGIDYDLGDKCDIVSHKFQKAFEARIIAVDEVWKANQHLVTLKLGKSAKTTYQAFRRSLTTERNAFGYNAGLNSGGSWEE